MTESSIILCPGQGAQHVGMAKAWAEQHPLAKKTFEEADDVLELPLSQYCFEGHEDQLNRTDIAQAAIYVASVACVRALKDRGEVDVIEATAGLSLGEYTALHIAGAFSFADGLKLVRQRGLFMQEASEAVDSSMVALIGCEPEQAEQLCDKAREDGVLVPANFNCPGQVVVSGSSDACERALQVASEMGLRAQALTVAGAFHSPLMQPAADRMAEALEQVAWSQPTLPVMSNVSGDFHDTDIDSIKALLVRQIIEPVRWAENVKNLVGHYGANDAMQWVEPAPGKVLSGLIRRIDRSIQVKNFAEPK